MIGVGSEPLSDTQLLAAVAHQDRGAFGQLYDRHAPTFLAAAVRIVGNQAEAEDVLQEALLSIWDKAGTYRSEAGAPFAWMITVVRNRALERLRMNRRRESLPAGLEARTEILETPAPGALASANERTERVRSAVHALPQDQREALEMAYFDAKTHVEIAQALKQPLGTIKTRIRRGLLRLRDVLDGVL
jgi:RNA polymerase sigma-70 factor (ECF subfamily)